MCDHVCTPGWSLTAAWEKRRYERAWMCTLNPKMTVAFPLVPSFFLPRRARRFSPARNFTPVLQIAPQLLGTCATTDSPRCAAFPKLYNFLHLWMSSCADGSALNGFAVDRVRCVNLNYWIPCRGYPRGGDSLLITSLISSVTS